MKPFRYFVRVRYGDCDSQHVVFNPRYGDYLDLAITEFLAATMPDRDPYAPQFEIQVKKQTVEWSAPARFNDVIEISTLVARMGKSSFDVRFEMRIAGTSDIIVASDTVYVHVEDHAGRWKSTTIPEGPKAQLLAGAKGRIVDHAGYFPIVEPKE
jgi:acyl-CoA thioester hydrolase